MHDNMKEAAEAAVETDREPREPKTFGLRFLRSMKAALKPWRESERTS
jgi:hypothetical protein